VLLWGANFVVSRILTGLPPVRVSGVYYAFFRYFFGALTMIAVLGYQRKGPKQINTELKPYRKNLAISALLSAIFVIMLHTSTEYIASGTSSIIVNLNPIIVFAIGALFLQEPVTRMKVAGFVLGVLGGLILLATSINMGSATAVGVTLAATAMILWAAYTISLQYLEGADSFIVMGVQHTVSTAIMIPFILLLLIEGVPLVLLFDIVSVSGLLFAGVLASGLAYVLYFTVIEIIGAARASSFLFLMPFVGVLGDFLLGEPPTFIVLLAGTAALLGVGMIRASDSTS
jgi:drug/metabolite transporter (DMT)-like permease